MPEARSSPFSALSHLGEVTRPRRRAAADLKHVKAQLRTMASCLNGVSEEVHHCYEMLESRHWHRSSYDFIDANQRAFAIQRPMDVGP
jgi:hypothetical protein